jgi:UDP-N-acetylmuramoyl-tripeptide--D-alanyl-D-alanine ligase
MNTPLGISRFIARLKGDEEVLIFELGEYYPGDIARLCELVRPQLGVITGINEAHLSKFKSLDRTTATIFELADYLTAGPVYKNGDSPLVKARAGAADPLLYTGVGVHGWRVEKVEIAIDGISFVAKHGQKVVHAHSGLLGAQNIGPLVACIDIADGLGLSPAQIERGIAATKPFEHRMQPRPLVGAWVIDDTYNGNSDGVKAGLSWLAAVPATRRIYVTPGLVEQGSSTAAVHEAIGRQIAATADVVVLIKNSVTPHIERGLHAAGFSGELEIVDNPVRFYSNLEQFVAAGDVVLMQNDWTDNYQ